MKNSLALFALLSIFMVSCSKDNSGLVGSSGGGTTTGDNTIIDNVNAANGDVSAVVDANDKIHVTYSSFNRGIKYATNKSGSWVATMIHPEDSVTTNGYYSDIAVDQNGYVHLVYPTSGLSQYDTSAIYYATNKSGAWVKTKIAFDITGSFSGAGIAVNSSGKVHIVYGNTNMQLWYTNDLGGGWSNPALIGSYWASVRPRLTVDASNNVYVAYEHGGERTLHLQTINSAGSFISNTVLDGGGAGDDRGWSPDIAIIKSNSEVLIVYWNYDSNLLKLYNNGTITTVDSLNWTDASIVTDNNGKAYISYTDVVAEKIYLTTNKTGSWVGTELPVSAVQRHSAVVVESTGKVNVIYNLKGASVLKMISQ